MAATCVLRQIIETVHQEIMTSPLLLYGHLYQPTKDSYKRPYLRCNLDSWGKLFERPACPFLL